MPIVNYQQYCRMLDNPKQNKFAYPAINTTSSETINAALLAFKEANSDGIIQVSTGGGSFASGLGVGQSHKGAVALAEFAHAMAAYYDVNIALHTDHCHPEYVDSFLMPLIEETAKRRAKGLPNLFSSHMYDGSALPMAENIAASNYNGKLYTDIFYPFYLLRILIESVWIDAVLLRTHQGFTAELQQNPFESGFHKSSGI